MSELSEKAKTMSGARTKKSLHRYPDDLDTAFLWATGQLSRTQITAAMGLKNTNSTTFYQWLLRQFTLGIQEGRLVLKSETGRMEE